MFYYSDLIKNCNVKEEINQRQVSIEKLIEKLYLKEKSLYDSYESLSTRLSRINDDTNILYQQENEMNNKISTLNNYNQFGFTANTQSVNLIQQGFCDLELNRYFTEMNVTECPLNIVIELERINNTFLEYKDKNKLNQEKHYNENASFNKGINELDNETRLIYDDLIINFNSDSTLQSEYQKFLKENASTNLNTVTYNDTFERIIKDIDNLEKQIDRKEKIENVKDQTNHVEEKFSLTDSNNKTNKSVKSTPLNGTVKEINFGNLNTPILKTNDKSFIHQRSQSSRQYKDNIVSVNYNKSFYLNKNKKLHDRIYNTKVVSLDDLGGVKCCYKLKENYNYEIKNSETKVRSTSLNTKRK